MPEKKALLILRLDGALQAWGEMSKWDFRDSADFPTKSGIVGLLGCALGLERGNPALYDLSKAITVAVRADRPGLRAVDFQTVTGSPLRTAEGKTRSGGNTIISRRAYLQDACFTVFIETDDALREHLVEALRAPKWPLYLGRKNCVPSRPVLEAVSADYISLCDASAQYPAAERAVFPMLCEVETDAPMFSSCLRPDRLVRGEREFALRRVWRGVVKEDADGSVQN